MKALLSMLVAFALLASAPPSLAGVVVGYSSNNVFLYGTADTAFVGVRVTDAGPQGFGNGMTDRSIPATVTVSSSMLPYGGDAEDGASGTMSLTFAPGAAGSDDSFTFTFSGSASALSAIASDRTDADARVVLQGSASFYLDSAYGGASRGSVVGQLTVLPLRAAGPYETFSIAVQSNRLDLAVFGPGSPGGSVTLNADAGYVISGKYEMLVPHGVDPPFTLTVGGGLTTVLPGVPEPSTYALMLAGLAALGLAARRRKT